MNSIRTTAAAFAIFVGLSIIGMWIFFLLAGQVPEWDTRPVETALHLTAEFLTALFLIAAGAGLISRLAWAKDVYLFSMGLLMYSVIQASGYFAQRGQITYTGMFAVFGFLAMMFTVLVMFEAGAPIDIRRLRHWKTW